MNHPGTEHCAPGVVEPGVASSPDLSVEVFRMMEEHSNDFVGLNHVDGRRLYISPSFMRVTGWTEEEIRATDWRTRVHPADLSRVEQARDANLRGEATTVEHRVRCKGGAWLWVETRCHPLRDASGNVDRMLNTSRDITARKHAEEALARSEAKFARMFRSSPDAVALTTLAEGRILEANDGYCTFFGRTRSELIGRTVFELGLWADASERTALVAELLARGRVRAHEVRFRARTGEVRIVHISAELMDLDGEAVILGVNRDVTEHVRLAEDLRERGRFEETLLSNLPGMVYRCANDAEWTMQFASDGCLALTGWHRAELEGNKAVSFGNLVHRDDRGWLWTACQRCLDAREPCDHEYRILRRDGSIRWVWDRSEGIYSGTGHLLAVEGFITDITERKHAENALALAEQKYRSLFDNAAEGIFQTSRSGRVLLANPAIARILGFESVEELMEVRTDIARQGYVQTGLRDEFLRRIERDGFVAGIEYEVYRKDGSKVWVAENARAVRDSHGAVACIEGTLVDISQRKQAEAALRESEERYRNMVEHLPDAVFINQAGHVVFANPACLRLLGARTAADIVGRAHLDLVCPEYHAEVRRAIHEVVMQGGHIPLATRKWFRLDGSTVEVEVTLTAVVFAGAPAVQVLARDLTERKRAEDALRDSRAQLRALVARLHRIREDERTRIAREVHDELGQMLTGLKMDVRWLERKLSDTTPPAANAMLDRVVAASELVDATIATVQKIASELRPGALEELGLEAALRQEARRFHERSGIECDLRIAPVPPSLAPETNRAVFHVFLEALTNVARHANASAVVIEWHPAGGEAVLSIRDDGVGLPAGALDEHASLGLLGMKERAEQAGGQLDVAVIAPRGTGVVLRVPLQAGAKPEGGTPCAS